MSEPRPEPQPAQQQEPPGDRQDGPHARPRRGELPRLGPAAGKAAVITGGDSGIGRAVAIAFAREGADVLISYLDEDEDAKETARVRRGGGPQGRARPRRHSDEPRTAEAIVDRAVEEFGRVDVLVNNAAFQMSRESLEEISDEEWDHTSRRTSTRCSTCARRRCRTCSRAARSSTPRR